VEQQYKQSILHKDVQIIRCGVQTAHLADYEFVHLPQPEPFRQTISLELQLQLGLHALRLVFTSTRTRTCTLFHVHVANEYNCEDHPIDDPNNSHMNERKPSAFAPSSGVATP
jgi:hypothetical protein